MADPVVGLVSALCEIFGVMLLAFIIFRLKLLQPADMKGFSWFTAKVALPTMLFGMTATLSTDFDIKIVLSVVIVKMLVGLLSYIPPMLILRTQTSWLTAATCMMSTMQSNDAALGLPLVAALFPQYTSVLVGILCTNAFFSAISVVLYELGASKRNRLQGDSNGEEPLHGSEIVPDQLSVANQLAGGLTSTHERQPVWRKVIFNLLQNPVLVMTALGLLYRFAPPFTGTLTTNARHQLQLPFGLNEIVSCLRAAFTPLVLFQMGEVIEQNTKELRRPGGLLLPSLLTAMKLIVTPALLLLLVKPMTGASGPQLESVEEFVVLYGLLPTSEAVMIFAKNYNCVTADIPCVVLLTHILCAPLMLFSNMYLQQLSLTAFGTMLTQVMFALDMVSIGFLIFFFASFILVGKRWFKYPMLNMAVLGLVLFAYFLTSQLLSMNCNIVLYVVVQGLRYSIDFLVMGMALNLGASRFFGVAVWRRSATRLSVAALILPWVIMLITMVKRPRISGPIGAECRRLLPAEELMTPAICALCLFGSLAGLSFSCKHHISDEEKIILEDLGIPTTSFMGEGVYLLVGIAVMTWLPQLVLHIGNVQGHGGQFLIFETEAVYNILAVGLCLMPMMRGAALERWQGLCKRRSSQANTALLVTEKDIEDISSQASGVSTTCREA